MSIFMRYIGIQSVSQGWKQDQGGCRAGEDSGSKQERRGLFTPVHHLHLQNSRTQQIMQKEDETKTLQATAREDSHWEKQVNSRGLLTGQLPCLPAQRRWGSSELAQQQVLVLENQLLPIASLTPVPPHYSHPPTKKKKKNESWQTKTVNCKGQALPMLSLCNSTIKLHSGASISEGRKAHTSFQKFFHKAPLGK